MKKPKILLLQVLLAGLLIVTVLFSTISFYNLKKSTLNYERASIYMAQGLLTNYQEILTIEKEILETNNKLEKEKLLAVHRSLYNIMFEYRNSVNMMVFYKEDIHQDFTELDLKISKAMLDFVKANNDEERLSAYKQLVDVLKTFSDYVDSMWEILSIEKEVI